MLEIKYFKDYRHNYLIIANNGALPGSEYQLKMITENRIKGLLPCQERHINGELLLYYEITSRQSFFHIYNEKRLGIKELHNFFVQLKLVNDVLQKYLLYGNGLMLQPEYIFQNVETGEYSFLYYPDSEEISFQLLMEFIISIVDNEDEEAVETVYKIADLAHTDQFAMDEILNWFPETVDEPEPPKPIESINISHSIQSEPLRETSSKMLLQEKKRRKKSKVRIFLHRLFGKQDEKEEIFLPKETERYMQTNEREIQKPADDLGNTVFIPWIENCENKLYGMDKGNKYHIDLGKLPLTVGKLAGAVDLVVREQSMSRMHAKFSRNGSKIYMTDLNSTNGTFKNGMRLEPNTSEIIEPGDEIRLGKLKFIYR